MIMMKDMLGSLRQQETNFRSDSIQITIAIVGQQVPWTQ